MYTDDKLSTDIQDLTTTTGINSYFTTIPDAFHNDDNDMTHILSYAMPMSCLAIVIVVLIAVGIYRRHHVLEKWTSLTRMKNTNPRFYERAGLRRDSEYDSSSDSCVNVTVINEDEQIQQEREYRVATIT